MSEPETGQRWCPACAYELTDTQLPGACPGCGRRWLPESVVAQRVEYALRCPNCRYDLSGTELPGACPECGSAWTREAIEAARANPFPRWVVRRLRSSPGVTVVLAMIFAVMMTHGSLGPGQFPEPFTWTEVFVVGFVALGTPYVVLRAIAWALAWIPARKRGVRPGRWALLRVVLPMILIAFGLLVGYTKAPYHLRVAMSKSAVRERASASSADRPTLAEHAAWTGVLYGRWVELGPGVGGVAVHDPMLRDGYHVLVYSPNGPPLPTPAHQRWYDEHGRWPEHTRWLYSEEDGVWRQREVSPGFWRIELGGVDAERMFGDPADWE